MVALPLLSRAAQAAGLPPRFSYWPGRSSRRYLFSGIDAESVLDFADGVVIATVSGRIVWAGIAADLAQRPPSLPRDTLFAVHLLANSNEERRRAVDDLRPAEMLHLKLAA